MIEEKENAKSSFGLRSNQVKNANFRISILFNAFLCLVCLLGVGPYIDMVDGEIGILTAISLLISCFVISVVLFCYFSNYFYFVQLLMFGNSILFSSAAGFFFPKVIRLGVIFFLQAAIPLVCDFIFKMSLLHVISLFLVYSFLLEDVSIFHAIIASVASILISLWHAKRCQDSCPDKSIFCIKTGNGMIQLNNDLRAVDSETRYFLYSHYALKTPPNSSIFDQDNPSVSMRKKSKRTMSAEQRFFTRMQREDPDSHRFIPSKESANSDSHGIFSSESSCKNKDGDLASNGNLANFERLSTKPTDSTGMMDGDVMFRKSDSLLSVGLRHRHLNHDFENSFPQHFKITSPRSYAQCVQELDNTINSIHTQASQGPVSLSSSHSFSGHSSPAQNLKVGHGSTWPLPSQKFSLRAEEAIRGLFAMTDSLFDFDMFAFEKAGKKNTLFYVGRYLFDRYDFCANFNIGTATLRNFLLAIEDGYRDNHYHNALHACECATFMCWLCEETKLLTHLADWEVFGVVISCLAHDIGHFGVSNSFMVAAGSEPALVYNDISVLENYHLAKLFRLLTKPECNITANMAGEDRRRMRSLIIDLVLATDMEMHIKIIKAFSEKVASEKGLTVRSVDDRRSVLKMAIKISDLGYLVKKKAYHVALTQACNKEFWDQGMKEKELGLPVSVFMDQAQSNIPKSQIGFMKFVVAPLFSAWDAVFPECDLVARLEAHYPYWEDLLAKGVRGSYPLEADPDFVLSPPSSANLSPASPPPTREDPPPPPTPTPAASDPPPSPEPLAEEDDDDDDVVTSSWSAPTLPHD